MARWVKEVQRFAQSSKQVRKSLHDAGIFPGEMLIFP